MPKGKTFNSSAPFLTLLALLLTLPAAAMESETLGDVIQKAKEEKSREFKRGAAPDNAGASAPVATIDPPQLVALYGVGQRVVAELSYAGRLRVVDTSGPLQNLGDWTRIRLQEDGVLLSRRAQRATIAANPKAPRDASRGDAACPATDVCLFLSVPRGARDPQRQLTLDDPQARMLMAQDPSRNTIPFQGKPPRPPVSASWTNQPQ